MSFEANAIGDLFEYSCDFIDTEIPLLNAGNARYYYSTAYEAQDGEKVIIRDRDGNSLNGITADMPKSALALSYVDLETGVQGSEPLACDRKHPLYGMRPDSNLQVRQNGVFKV